MLMLLILGMSLALTLAAELVYALVAGLRSGRELLLVVLVNVLTNPLVVTLYYTSVGIQDWVLLLEAGAVVAEWLCYRACSQKLRRPFLFALGANAFSYGLGCLINFLT